MNVLVVDVERWGEHAWRRYVADAVARLIAALQPEDVVLGRGNLNQLEMLPPGCRADAFVGGFRLWENAPEERRFLNTFTIRQKEHRYGNSRRTTYPPHAH